MLRTETVLSVLATLSLTLAAGCDSKPAPISSKSSGYEPAAAAPPGSGAAPGSESASGSGAAAERNPQDTGSASASPVSRRPPQEGSEEIAPGIAAIPDPVADTSLQVPDSADSAELVKFFAEADAELARLFSGEAGITDEQQLRRELLRVSRLKQEAAERVIAGTASTPEQARRAKHAKLEALSHQAGLQDARAAEALEQFAESLSDSPDPRLAFHSRVVQLGFAMDEVARGREAGAERVQRLATELTAAPELLDMPSAMAIQQALAVLNQYGHDGAASSVRSALVEATREHSIPQLAALSETLAGQSRFDRLGRASLAVMRGETAAPEELTAAVAEIAQSGADAEALQFVTASALNLEAGGFNEAARAVFAGLDDPQWSEADPAVAAEIRAALAAYQARQKVIGQPIEFSAPDLQGVSLDWSRYRGSVVVMPFWAVEYPQSLSVLPVVEEVVDRLGPQVRILGVNLDADDGELRQFLTQYRLEFPSIRSTSAEQRGMLTPLARTAGVGSLPFILVVDAKGRAARVVLDVRQLEEAVGALLSESAGTADENGAVPENRAADESRS